MGNMIQFGGSTMSSLELLELVNVARADAGESVVRRNDFHAKVRDELDGEHYETFVVENGNGTQSEAMRLTRDQCMYVLMRESKQVRRAVTAKLNEVTAIPQSLPEALRLAADLADQKAKAEAALAIAEAKKAEIGTRREATAMNTASQAVKKASKLEIELDRSKQYATVKRMEMLYHGQSFNWRLLKSTAIQMGIAAIDVFDANYGTVKAYHADVWREAYALEIEPHQ